VTRGVIRAMEDVSLNCPFSTAAAWRMAEEMAFV
jgi:hypothetical protein